MLARVACVFLITLAVVVATAVPAAGQCDPNWQLAIGAPGVNSTVWCALAVDEPSAIGPAVYAGGQFSTAGGPNATNIARWNGSAWSALGTGTQSSGTVYTLAAKDGYLYAGGSFASMGGQPSTRGIAKWDGSNWFTVGGGMSQSNSGPRAMVFWNSDLYVGGYQNELGGVTLHKLGRWNGVSWAPLPGDPIGTTESVAALGVYDDGGGADLYVGGTFSAAGGNSYCRNIFRWDGTSLTPLGRGTNDVVEALAVWNGSLYVGGHFTRVYQSDDTEVIANKIARWDGTQWSALGSGMNNLSGYHVWALNVFDRGTGDALYAGGGFTTAGGANIHYLATWDGATWGAVGQSNLNGYVYALTTSKYDVGLYAGGTFTSAGTPAANRIVRWAGLRPASPVNAAANPQAITIGDSSTLSASVAGATIYWYTDGCGSTFVGTGNSLIVSPTVTTTYYARAYNGTCYSYACSPVTVTVSCAPPAPADTAANPQAIVLGDSSTLSASVTGSTIYWYTASCGTTLIGTGDLLVVSPTTTTTYYARAYNGACFSDTCGSVTVTVDCTPPTPLNAAADPPSIIVGESSTLTASVSGATIYWYTGGCGTALIGTGDSLLVTPTQTTSYYARAYNGVCFSNTCGSVTVTVNCAPLTITQQPAGGVICAGHSLQLCVAAEGSGTIRYQWKRGGLSLIGATNPCYMASQAGAYTCIVTDDCTPVISDVAHVYLAAPLAGDFNGDGHTDFGDFTLLAACFAGPDQGVSADCECVDIVADGQIDLVDFAAFQPLYVE